MNNFAWFYTPDQDIKKNIFIVLHTHNYKVIQLPNCKEFIS